MRLEDLQRRLGWPARDQVLAPSGASASIIAQQVRSKVGRALTLSLQRNHPDENIRVEVGLLMSDAGAGESAAPNAIVCEFNKAVSDVVVADAHRLAWNFCRTPLLFTVEPTVLRSFTCCERPGSRDALTPSGELVPLRISDAGSPTLEDAEEALVWPALIAGELFRKMPKRFVRSGCADILLLKNLAFVRNELTARGLPTDVVHDLMARIIFTQFLFDRKDSEGRSALNPRFLTGLYDEGRLRQAHQDLGSVLHNKDDAYALFKLLDEHFNGDLFPTYAGATPAERERQWQVEMEQVEPQHLDLLGQFVNGRLDMRKGQPTLWQLYSFDVIPLEFISSIYEQFVNSDRKDESSQRSRTAKPVAITKAKSKAIAPHYTPTHVVDLVLDTVLPWESDEWDLKILDPACGSAAFLVNAFRRLVHRWRLAHNGEDPKASDLRSLLERNLFGVDHDPHAVRVASFSLYLAMCDEIDPRYYWQQVKFPTLRGQTIWESDFFSDDVSGFRTYPERGKYDLIIGNAPWGYDSVTKAGVAWAQRHGWRPANKNGGPLFLAKSMHLLSETGRLAMIQPAELLFNSTETFATQRRKVFSDHTVEEVINLSGLRFGTFKNAVGPACVFVMSKAPSGDEPVLYSVPKPTRSSEDDFRIVISPDDVHEVLATEAKSDPIIWTALMWGGRRDYALVRRLSGSGTLADVVMMPKVRSRSGIKKHAPFREDDNVVGRRMFVGDQFPGTGGLILNAEDFAPNVDPRVYIKDSTDFRAFEPVQLLVKLGWQAKSCRFSARLVDPAADCRGLLCNRSYYSISAPEPLRGKLVDACLFLNSKFATYYLLMTSGRFAMYRPEPTTDEFLQVPVPNMGRVDVRTVTEMQEVDRMVADALDLKGVERLLVHDTIEFTVPEFKGGATKVERARFASAPSRSMLQDYTKRFSAVLRGSFGRSVAVAPTIYVPMSGDRLPVCLLIVAQ